MKALTRRQFVGRALAAAGAFALSQARPVSAAERAPKRAAAAPAPKNPIAAFEKPIQSLDYGEMADLLAGLGFDGIEATVRANGHIKPERAADELPKAVGALDRRGLKILVMTTDITRADQPHAEPMLRTAAKLGLKHYRLGGFSYDLKRPIPEQLDALRPQLRELAALNRELGLAAVLQNHSGGSRVGAACWDLHALLAEFDVSVMGVAFDIRHATVEGGLCWPVHFHLLRPHTGVVYFKDFQWRGRKAENVPLGEGMVDPRFARLLGQSGFAGPISLHVEYAVNGREGAAAALKRDLVTLRSWLSGTESRL